MSDRTRWDNPCALTILVLHEAVEQNTRHGDSVTREVRVVVHALTDLEPGRRIPVTGKQCEDVVLSAWDILFSVTFSEENEI